MTTLVPKGRVELPWVAPADFESAAYAISPLRQVAAGKIVAEESPICETFRPVLSFLNEFQMRRETGRTWLASRSQAIRWS